MYKEGSDDMKAKLQLWYEKHVLEKNTVREIKRKWKEEAQQNNSLLCGSFDLQQVIYLPASNESAIFYKSRLATYNLTFYNIANRDCFCWSWHEGLSRRSSSEIATAVYKTLQHYDSKCVTLVSLFSDGCRGQNKNSVVDAMLLYAVVNSSSIAEISLRYFESFHGQNEGDSAHRAISSAVAHSGNVYIPSQLHPIFRLARSKQPYIVCPLQTQDFLDFKAFSKGTKILFVRTTDSGNQVKCSEIMELKVKKTHPTKIFFKVSHTQDECDTITLKLRKQQKITQHKLNNLNSSPNRISREKYQDLLSLCSGNNPVIRQEEHQQFFSKSLAHNAD